LFEFFNVERSSIN